MRDRISSETKHLRTALDLDAQLSQELQVGSDKPACDLADSQYTALMVLCDANFLFLHRPFFARAIQEVDPLSMPFARSFLAVSERSSVRRISYVQGSSWLTSDNHQCYNRSTPGDA